MALDPTTPTPKPRKRKTPAAPADTLVASSSKPPAPKKRRKDKGKDGVAPADVVIAAAAAADKGKARASEFRTVRAAVPLSLPPVYAMDARAGACEMLDSLVMQYVPALEGVLLAHSELSFPARTAPIKGDCPFVNLTAHFSALVWAPAVGMRLRGRISLSSPDHVALLVHRTFNASIPRHHIPQDDWAFEHGPAENDPEFGWGRVADVDAADPDADMDAAEAAQMAADPDADDAMPGWGANADADAAPGWGADALAMGGRWLARAGGAPLGGAARTVEFVVTALAVSNAMLSLRGSLQPDPFDPRHVPDTPAPVRAEEEEERLGSATAIEVDGDDSAVDSDADGDAFTREDELDGPEEDQAATFARLGRLADREKEKRAQDKEARKGKSKERKRAAKDAEEGGAEKKKKKKKARKEE